MNGLITHVPVLLQEVLDNFKPEPGGIWLDLTLGLGGHAEAILALSDSTCRYFGVDRDPEARNVAASRLGFDKRVTIHSGSYEDLWANSEFKAWCDVNAPKGFDCIFADLGISSLQIRNAMRGFSFMEEGPLDMRMDPEHGETALEWIGCQTAASLADALYKYGEERASRAIAKAILTSLENGKLKTTKDLAAAVYSVIPRESAKRQGLSDPATRTFQAIRIAVNGELDRLAYSIESAVEYLKPFGRIGIISFHSLEDRLVKHTLRKLSGIHDGPGRAAPAPLPKKIRLIHAGGITPGKEEVQNNPQSRSARLRIGERLAESHSRVL